MSDAVYPDLPGLTFDTGRNPKFNTRIHQAVGVYAVPAVGIYAVL
jgi:hypothetical protein